MSPKTSDQHARQRDERQQAIMMAAVQVFARQGFEATRMSDIATAAGVSNGLAYHYFPSKEELYHHIVEMALDTSIQGYRMAMRMPGPAIAVLSAILGGIVPVAYLDGGNAFFLIIMQGLTLDSVPGPTKDLLAGRIDEYFEILVPLFERGHADGTIRPGNARSQIGILSAILQGLTVVACTEIGRQHFFPDAASIVTLFAGEKKGTIHE